MQDYLQNNPNVKLITILSGPFARTLLARISEMEALHSVYIFTHDTDQNKETFREYPKLKGIFNTEDALYNKLCDDLFQLFYNEASRLSVSNHDAEARVYFDEVKRLLFSD